MRQFGDLEASDDIKSFDERAAHHGRYIATRSRWRFAVGSLEIGFARERERMLAERSAPRPQITVAQLAAPMAAPSLGERVFTGVGVLTALILVVGVSGWFWSMRSGAAVGRDGVSTAIVDIEVPEPMATEDGARRSFARPARPRPASISAAIERAPAGPAASPAARVAMPIADGEMVSGASKSQAVPNLAIIRSGNFAAIPNVAQAMTDAIASGDVQSWVAGSYHGVVVVGDANAAGCRKGTVLLRDGTPQGKTQIFERCSDRRTN